MWILKLAIVCGLLVLQEVRAAEWSYSGEHGPSHWKEDFSSCGQNQQSPINIYEGDVHRDPSLASKPLQFRNYDTVAGITMSLKNNGHSAVVNLAGDTQVTVTDGGLPGVFRAIQFHFHWGSASNTGSEHFISTHAYPMEVHIVHFNTNYGNFTEAIKHPDGLAVLGFMYEVSEFNPNYTTIVNNLPRILTADVSFDIPTVTLNSLLPQTFQNFYRYSGSLTTPLCQESVIWTVFKETIKISEQQLQAFRTLKDPQSRSMVDNYRPIQPLNSRSVAANFNPDIHWGYAEGHVDAEHWGHYYSGCAGESQSPVNIVVGKSQYDTTLGRFIFNNYDSTQGVAMMLKNNGHTAQVVITAENVSISGGGLPEVYRAAQFHLHWGASDMRGSEHTLDNRTYPMEIHIVHFKTSRVQLAAAATVPDGLAVLGFFFEVSATDNPALKPLIDGLINIQIPGNSTQLPAFSLDSILPQDKEKFFRYSGSLTTPSCSETVVWSVFNDTIKISPSQLAAFRNLKSSEKDAAGVRLSLVDNFRPVQNFNFRAVRNNFIKAEQPHWSYHGEHGADHWYRDYPTCEDKPTSRQSPINLEPKKVQYQEIKPFSLHNYSSVADVTMEIKNNGHTIEIDITGGSIHISGGGLPNPYKAAQLHFHWGADHQHGSEHLIDNQAYPMEIHVVHYNTIYPDFTTAASKSNGLAVLGFMYQMSKESNPAYDVVVKKLSEIRSPNSKASIQAIALAKLLPSDMGEFYRYDGSLTTPACYESVTWSIFRNTIKISESQLNAFRMLMSSDVDLQTSKYIPMMDNYRPTMNINKRVVQANFIISGGRSVAANVALLLVLPLATWHRFLS